MSCVSKLTLALLVAASFCLLPPAAHADSVIFSDLAASSPIYSSGGYSIAGSTSTAGFVDPAFSFTVGASSYNLTQIDLALSNYSGTNGSVTVDLVNNSGGLPGSTVLGSWTFSSLPANGSTNTTLQTQSGITGITLSAGTTYWLEAFVTNSSSNTFDLWNYNNQGDTGTPAENTGAGFATGVTGAIGAFDVLGTPVTATPEPSSLLLLSAGLAALSLLAALTRHKNLLGSSPPA